MAKPERLPDDIKDQLKASIERDESFASKPVSQIPEITTHHPPGNSILYSFERL
jgi:hypothetical protein